MEHGTWNMEHGELLINGILHSSYLMKNSQMKNCSLEATRKQ